MSDAPDKESKTELPSEKKIKDAVEKGNVPFSTEAGILSSFAAFLAVGFLMAAGIAQELTGSMALILENAATYQLSNGADAFQFVLRELKAIFLILLPLLCIISLGGIIGPLGQNMPQANLERLKPKIEKISPVSHLKRMFGKQGAFDFAKMLCKVIAVTSVSYWVIRNNITDILVSSASDVQTVPETILRLTLAVLAPLTLVALVIAIIDIVFTRLRWMDDLKMTRQEVKDEFKQSEGDPMLKERVRAKARQRVKSRMLAELPKATLVVVNPTHYAVALRYVREEGGAPIVIAKGIDHLALKIRSICEEQGTAVVENKPLARSLYASTEVGTVIPPDFYRAVAEVIHFVEMRKGRSPSGLSQA